MTFAAGDAVVLATNAACRGRVLAVHGEQVWVRWDGDESQPLTYGCDQLERASVDGIPDAYDTPVGRDAVRRWLEHQRLEGDSSLRAMMRREGLVWESAVIKCRTLRFLLDIADAYAADAPDRALLNRSDVALLDALRLPPEELTAGLKAGAHMVLRVEGMVRAEAWPERLAGGQLAMLAAWGGVVHGYTLLASFVAAVDRLEQRFGKDWRRSDAT
jgi:hypothetical protein